MRRAVLFAAACALGTTMACDRRNAPPSRPEGIASAVRSAAMALPVETGVMSFAAGADSLLAPRIDRLVVEIDEPSGADAPARWVRVDARTRDRRVFGYEILVDDVDFLRDPSVAPRVRRYLLYPEDGVPREYVDARDGSALTPGGVLQDWLVRLGPESPESASFLGRSFRREPDGPPGRWDRSAVQTFRLDRDVIIANGRDFRDDGKGRKGRDYDYVRLTPNDCLAMVDAGFNLFHLEGNAPDLGIVLPAYLVVKDRWEKAPELPLSANFLGAVMFVDEPAIHVMRELRPKGARSPEDVGTAILDATRRAYEGDGRYGRGFLAREFERRRLHYGSVMQPAYPAWEAVASAAWYELEAGVGGWCFESRLDGAAFAADVERALGVAFPADPADCIRLHLAIARGAARRFDAPWGVSVYGQMEARAAELLFPLAYDAGATYFWMWTSDGDHHLTHARQLELARALRAHATARPRRDMRALRQQADVALVLPWGYAFDQFSMGKSAALWGISSLALSKTNDAGVPYRDVLRAAAREVVSLLGSKTEFDILFLRDAEEADGYSEVRRVDRRGAVAISRGKR